MALGAAGNVAGAIASAPFAGDPVIAGTVAGLVSPAGTLALSSAIGAFRDRNVTAVVAVAADAADEEVEQLLHRMSSSPRLLEAFVRTARAAEATNNAEKILGLGRTMAAAMADDAHYDDEMQVLRALDMVESPHLRLLASMKRTSEEFHRLQTKQGGHLVGARLVDGLPIWKMEERSRLGPKTHSLASEMVAWRLLLQFEATHLALLEPFDVESTPMVFREIGGGVAVWCISPLGSTVLERISLEASNVDDGA